MALMSYLVNFRNIFLDSDLYRQGLMISNISANLDTYNRDQSSVFTGINLIYVLLFILAFFFLYNDCVPFCNLVISGGEPLIYDLIGSTGGFDSSPEFLSHDHIFLPPNLSFIITYLNKPL